MYFVCCHDAQSNCGKVYLNRIWVKSCGVSSGVGGGGCDHMAWPSASRRASDLHVINGIIKCDLKWNCHRHSTKYQYLFGFYLLFIYICGCASCAFVRRYIHIPSTVCQFAFISLFIYLLIVFYWIHRVPVYIHDADAFIYCHLLSFQVMHRLPPHTMRMVSMCACSIAPTMPFSILTRST